jgi:hypothetical protein
MGDWIDPALDRVQWRAFILVELNLAVMVAN